MNMNKINMDEYYLDTDNDNDNDNDNKEKIYTPKQLNRIFLNNTTKISYNFRNINMIGDITSCKLWKNGGMSFKLMNNNESFECKVWDRDGYDKKDVFEFENKTCKIFGYIKAEYFYGHRFVLNVLNINMETDDSKLKRLKEECNKKDYFKHKKEIKWENIKKIGIISKNNTQGYNDFMKQYNKLIPIMFVEISLEGPNTSKQCIESIEKLQDVDVIILIRGGGDTSEISNSYDKIELFDAIKKSKIPIITAIGHENDKGDKLLITEVSDKDYPTPSTAVYEINKIILDPVLKKLNAYLSKIESMIDDKFNKEYEKLYNGLKCLSTDYMNKKFGGPILKIENDEKFILIEKDGYLYKNSINFNGKMDFTAEEVSYYGKINDAIDDNDIETIEKYFNVTENNNTLIENIKEYIKKIKKISKLEDSFENVNPKLYKILYCKKCDINDFKIKKLIQLYSMNLKYIKIFEENDDKTDVYKIFNFLLTEEL